MQKVILYMAISADGFIADENDATPWSDEEWDAFQAFAKSCDKCLIGRKTYEIMKQAGDFVEGANFVVVTHDNTLETGKFPKCVIQTKADIPAGERIGLCGGGDLNGCLAGLDAINEVILDIEPIALGAGKRLFGDHKISLGLELLKTVTIGQSTVQNHYIVLPKSKTNP